MCGPQQSMLLPKTGSIMILSKRLSCLQMTARSHRQSQIRTSRFYSITIMLSKKLKTTSRRTPGSRKAVRAGSMAIAAAPSLKSTYNLLNSQYQSVAYLSFSSTRRSQEEWSKTSSHIGSDRSQLWEIVGNRSQAYRLCLSERPTNIHSL